MGEKCQFAHGAGELRSMNGNHRIFIIFQDPLPPTALTTFQ